MNSLKRLSGLYVHIPFCLKKCAYCSFYSLTDNFDFEGYFRSLEKHFRFLSEQYRFSLSDFDTLYFGGGTPSCVPIEYYRGFFSFLEKFIDFGKLKEITFELNPETVSENYLKELKTLGINRLSIGIQSLDSDILNRLNRVHSVEKAVSSVEKALNYFENLSVDFIAGIRGQENKDIETLFDFPFLRDIKHISVYILEGEKNEHLMAEDDFTFKQYLEICRFLEKKGFNRYEISNFAKKGYESVHNIHYWQGDDYLGVGVSAHSLKVYKDKAVRFFETADFKEFVKGNFQTKEQVFPSEEIIKEFFMLGLRMRKGVNAREFEKRWGVNPYFLFSETLEKFNSYFILENDNIRLNEEGVLISNEIFESVLFD